MSDKRGWRGMLQPGLLLLIVGLMVGALDVGDSAAGQVKPTTLATGGVPWGQIATPIGKQETLSALVLRVRPDSREWGTRPTPWAWTTRSEVRFGRFAADPRRWPRLFANTTECTLSLDPITRRHWWQ